jgi:prepilin-type N-terminal cleavage/methylation domain-containing protein
MKKKKMDQSGFTIIELIIATTVFGVMMLLATAGIIQIGKIYYKGVTTARTQETTRAIVDEISRSIQMTDNTTLAYSASDGANGERSTCVGTTRYTYLTNGTILRSTDEHVLWTDQIKSGASCAPLNLKQPNPVDGNTDTSVQGKELLARNMRLAEFNVGSINGTSLKTVRVKVIYGDLDLYDNATNSCLPISQGGQFCAASSLSTSVKQRL